MVQELIGIRRLQGEAKGLDANWTLTDISFNLSLWSIPMYRRPAALAVVPGQGIADGEKGGIVDHK